MSFQEQVQFKHDDASVKREFEGVYKAIRALKKGLLLEISEAEPQEKYPGLRWYQQSTDTIKEWTGDAWKQLYPGVFAE